MTNGIKSLKHQVQVTIMLNSTSASMKTLYLRYEYEVFKLAGKIVVYSKICTKQINTLWLVILCETVESQNYSRL